MNAPSPHSPLATSVLARSGADVSIVVVEDDDATRAALCAAIDSQPGMRVAASFVQAKAAIQWIEQNTPDVLLTDLGLPDGSGIDVIKACALLRPQCDIMVITMFGDEQNVLASIDAGAVGYILKDLDDLNVTRFIADLREGGSPMSPIVARKLLTRVRQPEEAAQQAVPVRPGGNGGLTARELETLDLIARGYTYNEIATLLSLSRGTVQTHIKNIYAKLSVHSRGEAVFEAHKLGLLQTGLLSPDRH